jgi:hypothetical protein
VKFTPGSGRIGVNVEEAETGELIISVADTGIGMGMAESEIEIALQPFGQVDYTLPRSFEGTGLGLPLARRLTELHRGRLEIISVKGKGTTVKIILPTERMLQRDGARVESMIALSGTFRARESCDQPGVSARSRAVNETLGNIRLRSHHDHRVRLHQSRFDLPPALHSAAG